MRVGSGKLSVPALQAGLIASVIVVSSGGRRPGPAQGRGGVRDPIEEPWVNQIHVALLRAKDEFGIEYTWSESVPAISPGCSAAMPSRVTA